MSDGDPTGSESESATGYSDDVEVLEQDGRRFVLVGTAHVSANR